MSLDQLQERLGELLVALLLDASMPSPLADQNIDSRSLLAEFGRLIEAMQQLEHAATPALGAHAETAKALGNTAYQLLELLALQLQPSHAAALELIKVLQSGFADWVLHQRGTPIFDSSSTAALTPLPTHIDSQPSPTRLGGSRQGCIIQPSHTLH